MGKTKNARLSSDERVVLAKVYAERLRKPLLELTNLLNDFNNECGYKDADEELMLPGAMMCSISLGESVSIAAHGSMSQMRRTALKLYLEGDDSPFRDSISLITRAIEMKGDGMDILSFMEGLAGEATIEKYTGNLNTPLPLEKDA